MNFWKTNMFTMNKLFKIICKIYIKKQIKCKREIKVKND